MREAASNDASPRSCPNDYVVVLLVGGEMLRVDEEYSQCELEVSNQGECNRKESGYGKFGRDHDRQHRDVDVKW